MKTSTKTHLTVERISYVALACAVPIPIPVSYSKLQLFTFEWPCLSESLVQLLLFVHPRSWLSKTYDSRRKEVFTNLAVAATALVLVGCTSVSPGIPSIFLTCIKLSSGTQIRIGYFGMGSIPVEQLLRQRVAK